MEQLLNKQLFKKMSQTILAEVSQTIELSFQ